MIESHGHREGILTALQWSIGAYKEALKFIPRRARRAPNSAVFTENGRQLRDKGLSGPYSRVLYESSIKGYERRVAELR